MREKKQFNFAARWERQMSANSTSAMHTKTLAWGIIGVLIMGLFMSAPWLIEYKLNYNINQLNQKISALGDVNKLVNQLNALMAQTENQKKLNALVLSNTKDPGPVLDKLKKILPTGTTISTFALQADNTLTLKINAPSPVDVARLWMSLRDSGLFQGVDIPTVSLQDKMQVLNLNLKLK